MPTTETDDRLMAAAAIIGKKDAEDRMEHAGRDRNAQRVVAKSEGQVAMVANLALPGLAVRTLPVGTA